MAIMQVSRKIDYALRAVIHLANEEASDRACSVAEIAARERIPRQFLEKIVRELIHKGLVRSRRGPHGGYVLARPADPLVPIYLFLATLPCDALSAFLAFCGRVVYSCHRAAPTLLHLSPLQDQQCAGALMWFWVTVAYLIPAIAVTLRLLSRRTEGESLPSG